MESFWETLKTELVFHRRYATRKEAEQDITEYIELFYNRMRTQENSVIVLLRPLLRSFIKNSSRRDRFGVHY